MTCKFPLTRWKFGCWIFQGCLFQPRHAPRPSFGRHTEYIDAHLVIISDVHTLQLPQPRSKPSHISRRGTRNKSKRNEAEILRKDVQWGCEVERSKWYSCLKEAQNESRDTIIDTSQTDLEPDLTKYGSLALDVRNGSWVSKLIGPVPWAWILMDDNWRKHWPSSFEPHTYKAGFFTFIKNMVFRTSWSICWMHICGIFSNFVQTSLLWGFLTRQLDCRCAVLAYFRGWAPCSDNSA
jgi:hypothetical protein